MKINYFNEKYDIQKKLNEKDNELKQALNELNKQKQTINDTLKLNKEYENKIKDLENQLKEKTELIEKISKEKELKEINNQESNNNLIIKDKTINELTNENAQLKQDINKLNEKIKEYDIKINQNNINDEKNILNLKQLEQNNNDLEEQIEILQSELNQYKNNKDLENKKITEQLSLISEKEEDISNKLLALQEKENLIKKENEEFEKAKEELQKIITEHQKTKQINEELKRENEDLENEIKEKQKIYEKLLSNINKIKKNKKKKNLNRSFDGNYEFEEGNKKKRTHSMDINRNIEPIKLFISPTLIGLNNIGATCFMNSTLQCLSQTKALTNYFLNERNMNKILNNNIAKINKNELQLSPIYLELINNLWSTDLNKSFSPNNFMNIIEKMNPLFKIGQAGDAKDFIIFILEQIHKELKEPIKSLNNNINVMEPLNQYDKDNAFNHFFSDFKKECSIISDIFFGFNETTNVCLNCKNNFNSQGLANPVCYNYGIFNCLIFPLEEVRKMKNMSFQQNNIFNINTNRVTLYECFYYNQKGEYFTGENRNYCNYCKLTYDSIYTSKIYVSPNILILILNRGKDNVYDVKIDFTEIIDITQFILLKDIPQLIYDLYGVITHIGTSGPNAHFVASCKSPVDNKWYRYNDAIVSSINNVQKEIIEFGTPYILFYQKRNNN